MIQIERIYEIPDLEWSEYSGPQALGAKEYVAYTNRTKEMFLLKNEDGPIVVVGLTPTTMIGTGHLLWCLFCKCDLKKVCRSLHKLLLRYVRTTGHLTVMVDSDYAKGMRLAQFFDFVETNKVPAIDGRNLAIFELDKTWLTR